MYRLHAAIPILAFASLLDAQSTPPVRFQGNCAQGNGTVTVLGHRSAINSTSTPVSSPFPGCTVAVYLAGTTTLATVYADPGRHPKASGFAASIDGSWFFYADDGTYDVRLSAGGNPIPLTLDSYETASVKDFGAQGDGSTDDSASIAKAITYSSSNQACILFPHGTYMISSTILIPAHTCLRGEPNFSNVPGGSVIQAQSGFTGEMVNDLPQPGIPNPYSIFIEGLTFDGNNKSALHGIHLGSTPAGDQHGSFWTLIRNVTVSNVHGYGVWIYGGTTVTLDNVVVEYYDGAYGIMMNGGFDQKVYGSTTEWSGSAYSAGIGLIGCHSCIVEGAYTEQTYYGVAVAGQASDISIIGGWFNPNGGDGYALLVGPATRTTLIANTSLNGKLDLQPDAVKTVVINPHFSSVVSSEPDSVFVPSL